MSELSRVDRRAYLKYVGALAIAVAGAVGGYYPYVSLPKPELPRTETQTQIAKNIAPKEAYTLIQNNRGNPNFVILDVRTPAEFAEEHIEYAINLDYYSETFRDDLDKLNKTKTYLIYCRTGSRGESSLAIMKELGFREVYNISGGITEWKAEGFPTTK